MSIMHWVFEYAAAVAIIAMSIFPLALALTIIFFATPSKK